MSTTFKTFLNNDVVSTRTLLHEAIPITGSILSGTYGTYISTTGTEPNIKTYSHGMFQSVYDYPYLSSSSNHLMDITVGISDNSGLSGGVGTTPSSPGTHQAKKINIYNTMAQVLMGHDKDGNIQEFDKDGDLAAGGTKLKECIFFNFSRLLIKDEVKKGSFKLELGVSGSYTGSMHSRVLIQDTGSTNQFYVNTPIGEYGILSADNSIGTPLSGGAPGVATMLLKSTTLTDYGNDGSMRFTLVSQDTTSVEYAIYRAGPQSTGGTGYGYTHIQLATYATISAYTAQVKAAIESANGHQGKLTATISTTDATNDTITITNVEPGTAGNSTIPAITAGDADALTINGGVTATAFAGGTAYDGPKACGLLFYQAGIAVVTASVFLGSHAGGAGVHEGLLDSTDVRVADGSWKSRSPKMITGGGGGQGIRNINEILTSSTIDVCANSIRHRVYNISFNNTTELNSTIYFCRANHNDFNYSANPTYLNSSKIRVKDVTTDNPVSYITTIGLYSSDNELLAVAKLSEPLKKDPSTELTLRVRLDY